MNICLKKMKQLDKILEETLSEMSDEEFDEAWTRVKGFEDKNNKYIEYVYKIGDVIDDNAFGGTLVTEEVRKQHIERIKERWRESIRCPLMLFSEMKHDESHEPPYYLHYSTKPNPYYGWTEKQLEIREYGTNKHIKFKW